MIKSPTLNFWELSLLKSGWLCVMPEQEKLHQKLKELNDEYQKLKENIDNLSSQRVYDQLLVQRLKRRKLQLKDQITHLKQSLCDDIIA